MKCIKTISITRKACDPGIYWHAASQTQNDIKIEKKNMDNRNTLVLTNNKILVTLI